MEDLQSTTNQPDFSTLTGIMDYFHRVPFETFQKDLNDWFSKALLDKGIDPENIQIKGHPNLSSVPDLVSQIYHQAELLKTVSEFNIKPSDEIK
jgi:hypothetical protein